MSYTVTDKVKQRGRNRTKQITGMTKGETGAFFDTLKQLPKINIRDTKQLRERSIEYFTKCGESGRLPSFEGFAASAGCSRHTLTNIIKGRVKAPPEVAQELGYILEVIGCCISQAALQKQVPPTFAIFLLRNLGYKNKDIDDWDISVPEPQESMEDIKKRYRNL